MRERNEFTHADYAIHPRGGSAVRDRGDGYWPWKVSYHREVEGPRLSDIEMKQGGWEIPDD